MKLKEKMCILWNRNTKEFFLIEEETFHQCKGIGFEKKITTKSSCEGIPQKIVFLQANKSRVEVFYQDETIFWEGGRVEAKKIISHLHNGCDIFVQKKGKFDGFLKIKWTKE